MRPGWQAGGRLEDVARPLRRWTREEVVVARYWMVHGDDEQVVRETSDDVPVVDADGWTVLLRGDHAILRPRDGLVPALERLD